VTDQTTEDRGQKPESGSQKSDLRPPTSDLCPSGVRLARPEDLRALVTAAAADGAKVVAPTHVLEQDGQVTGYGSAGKLAVLAGWTAPTVSDAKSLDAFRLLEMAALLGGAEVLVVICTDTCRFKPFMGQEGYTAGQTGTVYFKKVKG